jgi:O-antigen/teichoic acid export membrane protein
LKNSKTIASLLSTGIEFAVGFGMIAVLTRVFEKEVVGHWFIFMAIFSIASGMRDAFVQTALVKGSIGVGENSKFSNLKANLLTTISLEMIISSVMVLLALSGLTNLSVWLLIYPAYSIPNALFRWSNFYFRGNLQMQHVLVQTLINALLLAIGISLIIFNGLGIEMIILLWGLANTIALLFSLPSIPLKSIFRADWQLKDFKLILKFGGFATLRELSATLSTRIGLFLSGSMLGLTQTALLGTAQRYTQIVFMPNNAMQALLFPEMVALTNKGKIKEAATTLSKGLAKILALVFLVGFLIILGSFPIVYFLHGQEYLAAVPILILFVFISSFFTPFGTAFGSFVTAIGKPHLSSKIVFINSLLNISLTFILIKAIGLYGVPLALLCTEIFGYVMIGRILKKEAGISFLATLRLIPNVYRSTSETLATKLNIKFKTVPAK